MRKKIKIKVPKSHKPGIRVPTAKGSIAFTDGKKYNRKKLKKLLKKILKERDK